MVNRVLLGKRRTAGKIAATSAHDGLPRWGGARSTRADR